jgi:iron complex outermembrane receptor protein
MSVRPTVRAALACAVMFLLFSISAAAQSGAVVSGRVLNSLTGEPIAGATVVLEEAKREAVSTADGAFSFDNVVPGTYHLLVRGGGLSSRRTEVAVTATPPPLELRVDPELHFEEVVSVSAEARSQFETFQPTSVLAGQELTKRVEMSLGATLAGQPGVSSRSLGPAPARPVIRGLDGDRVQILQDGQRLGDLSSQSGDHGVSINPAAATRIEVVRGPATLLYGANAIGGLVNIISDEIPTRPEEGVGGNATVDLGSAAREAAGAGDVHVGNGTLALHVGGGGRRSGDVRTPEGAVVNSQSRNGFGNVGLAWTATRGYVGGSYGYDNTRHGVPVIEAGTITLTPQRHALTFRGGARDLDGAFDSFRVTLGHRRYRHDELEGGDVGTRFRNDTTDLEVMGSHRAVGRLQGSGGLWVLDRSFSAEGEEALSPPVDERGYAAFLYEELTWPHVTFQFGGRVDRTVFSPLDEPRREFTNGSASVGLLLRPAAANDSVTIALSLARAARNPALEELFFFGLHHGNFAVEVGDPALGSEHALGLDLSLRWRTPRASGEVTYFRNRISDFIFRNQISHEEFEAREDEFIARHGGREPAGHEHASGGEGAGGEGAGGEGTGEEIAYIEFVGSDALLQGVEAHADVQITPRLALEAGVDYVRGTLTTDDSALPRMPPLRGRLGLRYQHNAFQAGAEVTLAAAQRRVAGAETPTEGYQLLRVFTSYSFGEMVTSTITARLDNATNTLYRNHLSLIKDLVPEPGISARLLYSVGF